MIFQNTKLSAQYTFQKTTLAKIIRVFIVFKKISTPNFENYWLIKVLIN